MTSINANQQSKMGVVPSLSQQTPAPGQKVEAAVLGATRRGVSVRIGRDTLQLEAPYRLADAKTLTLAGTASSAPEGQNVEIVARDGLTLAKPVPASLTAGSRASSPGGSTIMQTGRIEVVAQPVGADGNAFGSRVSLQLQAHPPAAASAVAAMASTSSGMVQSGAEGISVAERNQAFQTADVKWRSADHAITGGVSTTTGAKPTSLGGMTSQSSLFGPSAATPPGAAGQKVQGEAAAVLNHGERAGSQGLAPSSATASGYQSYGGGAGEKGWLFSNGPSGSSSSGSGEFRLSENGQGRSMTATVVARVDTQRLVLNIADQLFRVEQPLDLPLGTTLQAVLVPSGSMTVGLDGLADQATALTKLVGLLEDIDRAGRQAGVSEPPRHLPGPDKHLASRFLALLSAESTFPSQDSADVSLTQRDQLQSLIRDLGGLASEPLADGWKSLTLPFGSDQAQAVCFFFRDQYLDPDEGASDGDAELAEVQRAVFDVSFSRLGRCQIDALCQGQRFDLIVRGERPLHLEDREMIAGLFASACEIAGMKGDVGFIVGNFFEPPKASAAKTDFRS